MFSGELFVFSSGGNGVLTHPYACELATEVAAQATVRVRITRRARLELGYGQAKGRPRAK
jgi:hypothetical protein